MSDPILEQLQAVLEAARREAYERGYADAVKRIVAAASSSPASVSSPVTTTGDRPVEGVTGRTRARRGSIEARLVEILRLAPEGLTVAEIESLGSSEAEPLKLPSIRVTLQRLLAAGRVTREGRRWRFAAPEQVDERGQLLSAEPATYEPPERSEGLEA